MSKPYKIAEEVFVSTFNRLGGSVRAVAKELGLTREPVLERARKLGLVKKPLAAGKLVERPERKMALPPKGIIKRYICTSAQNNTHINQNFWDALLALADYYDAQILVGTFTYNQNAFGRLAVKKGTKKPYEKELWYDEQLHEYLCDERLELADGLAWCGEMNILPTAVDPLSGLETYTHRKSAIFPHAKLAMRSIATMQGEGTKLNYTTGTVTQRNYIQKKEGVKAEHHHRYAALVVEVNDKGNWWVRQIGMGSKSDVLQDLDVAVIDGEIVTGQKVEAITWGDLHATMVEEEVVDLSMGMLDVLMPRFQFIHDVMEGASISRHQLKSKDPHTSFYRWKRGLHRLKEELERTAVVLNKYLRPWSQVVVPSSNHDGAWLHNWLQKFDYRVDPANAILFLKLQAFMYEGLEAGLMPRDINITERAFEEVGLHKSEINFLLPDESFVICGKKIECGMHGHLGPSGARGTPDNLNKIGRRANTGHTHAAGIWNGLYVAGTSTKLKWDYTLGPSAWSHSHIVTYPNGQRAIVTMYGGRWRA